MNYSKYITDGWGLTITALKQLAEIIASFNKDKVRVIEFGSGKSTEFLHDYNKELNFELEVLTFDNDPNFAYKEKENDNVTLLMRNLVECSDKDFEKMFKNKSYDSEAMKPKTSPLTTRQRNNFYDIKHNDINGIYDIVILDGPNGNGRNLAFLHLIGHLDKGSYVLIDDTSYYKFVDRFKNIFDSEVYYELELGPYRDNFSILKIK